MIAFLRIPIFMGFLWLFSNSKFAQYIIGFFIDDEPREWIFTQIAELWSLSVVYFTKTADLSQLNRALRYIEENEEVRQVRIVHIFPENTPEPYNLMECVH